MRAWTQGPEGSGLRPGQGVPSRSSPRRAWRQDVSLGSVRFHPSVSHPHSLPGPHGGELEEAGIRVFILCWKNEACGHEGSLPRRWTVCVDRPSARHLRCS